MQSIKKTPKHLLRSSLIIAGALIVLTIAYTATAFATKLWPFDMSSEQAAHQSNDNATEKESSTENINATEGTPAPGTTTTAKDTPAESTPQQTSGTVSIPFAQQNGDTLRITTLINGVQNTGTCTMTLMKESTTITVPPVGIQAGPSSSTCQGFNLPISSYPQLTAGVWDISISVDTGTAKASATSKVTVK